MSEVYGAIWGTAKWGQFRWGVGVVPILLDRIFTKIKSLLGGTLDLSWNERSKIGVDGETGMPVFSWAAKTIQGYVQSQPLDAEYTAPGVIPVERLRIYCLDGVKHLDRFTWQGHDYEVCQAPKEVWVGNVFICRICVAERLKD